MKHANPFDESTPIDQPDVEALIQDLIRELGAGPKWENASLDDYLDAIGRWLDSQRTPARESLERRLLGHVLFPRDCDRLQDYFEAVLARVQQPYEGWPAHLKRPEPNWRVISQALSAGRLYE